jgi:hypothetical protein
MIRFKTNPNLICVELFYFLFFFKSSIFIFIFILFSTFSSKWAFFIHNLDVNHLHPSNFFILPIN